jgi:NB-ARC domain/WD domain, G-beta repeat/APAF-1 helical domain
MASLRPAVHRTILVVDVEGFGNRHRTNPHQVTVRGGLYRALQQAFGKSGIPWARCRHEDRGDGVLVLAPSEVPKGFFVESLPHSLVEALCEHNRVHVLEERIRLRMALHAGEINYDDHGVAGTAINLAFRLLDAPPLKAALADSPGVLAVITSSWFFDEVVRHSTASSPATYRPMRVTVKETTTVAWVCLPDHPYSPGETILEAPPTNDAPLLGNGAAELVEAMSFSAGVDNRRRPWMAPPLDRMVERPDVGDRLVAALVAPGMTEVGLTTGLHGVGGFGKTTLATWVCHHEEITRCYEGGLLWVTIGQEVPGTELAERINDLTFALCGQRPTISNPEVAGAELGRLLDERGPVLLVIDDIWTQSQLRPFRFGGRHCTRLITTRVPDLLPPGVLPIAVDAMSDHQARQLVAAGVDELPADMVYRLASAAGRWPVLLNLINGVLQRWIARGRAPAQAAEEILDMLAALGPRAFDPARPAERARAVEATMEASLSLLSPADRQRCLDLAIFPEDVHVPLNVLMLLWPQCRVEAVCENLFGIGRVADYRLDSPGPRLVVHDVIRAYLLTCRSVPEQAEVHRRLIVTASELLPASEETSAPWWLLPVHAGYLWRYLPYHLQKADQDDALADLVCDLRWVEAKTRRYGSVVAVEADLELVDTPTAATLRQVLGHAAPLLGPIDPPAALGATLATRVHGIPALQAALDDYRARLPRPRLEPAWPLPDQPDLAQAATPTGHTGAITSCIFSPDGTVLATSSDDGTARLWQATDGTERAVFTGHVGGVWDCAFSPDGSLLATVSDDHTARLWNVSDGTLHTVLSGHTEWVQRCAFSPDGTLLATTSSDQTARLWRIADGREHVALVGHTSAVTCCAFAPDGTLLATSSDDGTARLWQVSDGTQHEILATLLSGIQGCAFSPDGTLLATVGDDGTARLWQASGDAEQTVLTGHVGEVWACAFSPDGTLLATTDDLGMVRLWRVRSGATQAVLTGHWAWVRGCAFSPDGALLATTGNDQTLRIWHIPDGTIRYGANRPHPLGKGLRVLPRRAPCSPPPATTAQRVSGTFPTAPPKPC